MRCVIRTGSLQREMRDVTSTVAQSNLKSSFADPRRCLRGVEFFEKESGG